jgi:hypothetical protein
VRAHSLPAARGWYWFVGGLKLWQRSPGIIGLFALLAFTLPGIIGNVPVMGSLLICLMSPFLDVFLLRVCHSVFAGRRESPLALVKGYISDLKINSPSRMVGLLVLGVVTFVCLFIGKGLVMFIAGDAMAQVRAASEAATAAMSGVASPATDASGAVSDPLAAAAQVSLPPKVMLALFIKLFGISVLSIIMWIAPVLTAFADVPPVKSLFFSIIACWRNKGAFLVFGLSLACLSIPLSVVMLLGNLGQMLVIMLLFGVFMPACFASNYLSVMDIFGPVLGPTATRDPQDVA